MCVCVCVCEREGEERGSCTECVRTAVCSRVFCVCACKHNTSLVRTCGLFCPDQHVVSRGVKHEAANSGYLGNRTVRALC